MQLLQLPYRTPTKNAFSSELSFEFELNEYGDRDAGFYAIATGTANWAAD
jgi:hypothetical protein